MKVLQEKIKVAAYSGMAGWDFQYVRNALSRSPWADLKDDILPDAATRCPPTADEILKQDVILLFDVASGSLDTGQWDAVNRLVTERGGSVILIAGDAHLPGEYASTPLTSALLPYPANHLPAWRTWPGERPAFHFMPAPGAQSLDALKFEEDSESTERRWQQLPPFFRFLPISPLKPNTRALLLESDSGLPVLTESRLGAGRVFFSAPMKPGAALQNRREGSGPVLDAAHPLCRRSAVCGDAGGRVDRRRPGIRGTAAANSRARGCWAMTICRDPSPNAR